MFKSELIVPFLCSGVVKQRKCVLGRSKIKWITSSHLYILKDKDNAEVNVQREAVNLDG